MIVKNEATHLDACLRSAKGLADEIIIVDTGSTDTTIEIAKKYTENIFHFPWCNDFAAARNFSLQKATGDWIIVLDADEIIKHDDHEKIKKLLAKEDACAYFLHQIEYTNDASLTGFHFIRYIYKKTEANNFLGFVIVENAIRLFRNNKGIHFAWKIHETVQRSLEKLDIKPIDSGIHIHHYKQEKDAEIQRNKMLLYLSIGESLCKDNPHEAKPYYEIGLIYYALGRWNDAALAFEKVIGLEPKIQQAYHKLARTYAKMHLYDKAIALYEHYFAEYGKQSDILADLGLLYCMIKDFPRALDAFHQALQANTENVLCRHNLSILYLQLQRKDDALALLKESEYKFPNPFTFNTLGILAMQDNKKDMAKKYFEKGIACAPNGTQQIILDLKRNLALLQNQTNPK